MVRDRTPTAYGLSLSGLSAERHLLGAPHPGFPRVSIEFVEQHDAGPVEAVVDGEHCVRRLPSGHVLRASRIARTATLTGPPTTSDERVHPLLAPIAAIHNRWLGREVFHAGVFAAADRAWVVVGAREAGKSSLLAGLDARGHRVLADDVAMIDPTTVYSGPRCIDLRGAVPGVSSYQRRVRGGTRSRMAVPMAPAVLPLGGWVFPRWGGQVRLIAIPPQDLIGLLARARGMKWLASDPTRLLSLAGHPAWILERPQNWAYGEAALSALLDTVTVGESRLASSR